MSQQESVKRAQDDKGIDRTERSCLMPLTSAGDLDSHRQSMLAKSQVLSLKELLHQGDDGLPSNSREMLYSTDPLPAPFRHQSAPVGVQSPGLHTRLVL